MSDNIFEKLTPEEQGQLWMYMIFNRDKIIEKTEKWTKEAEKRGMTLTEYLESISPLNNMENYSIKTVTNAKEAEAYPISEDISKGFGMTDEQTKQAILGFTEFFKGITGDQNLEIPSEIAEKYGIQEQAESED